MGCEQSRPKTSFDAPASFRDQAPVSWFITNGQWRTFVEQTYTPEFCDAQAKKVDCYEIWKDMNQTDVDDWCVIGRQVYMGPDYVSYGRVLVPKKHWHSYAGVWSTSDASFTSGGKQQYQVQIPEEGGLICTCTATGTVVWKSLAATSDASLAEQADSEGSAGTAEAETAKDGNVQVFLGGEWVPGEIRRNSYEELSVIVEGKAVGTFTRELALIGPEHKQFEGEDWVFGSITPGSEVRQVETAKFMTLHLCHVDNQKGILQVLCHLGRSHTGRVGSITVPIPEDKLSAVQGQCSLYSKFRRPFYFEGRVYYKEADMLRLVHQWMLRDLALRTCTYALLHYDVVYGGVSAGADALVAGLETGLTIGLQVTAIALGGGE